MVEDAARAAGEQRWLCVRLPVHRKWPRRQRCASGCSAVRALVCVGALLLVIDVAAATRRRRFTNQWAVKVDGDNTVADRLAAKHGFSNVGQIMPQYYLFVARRLRKRSTRSAKPLQRFLSKEPQVRWLQQQVAKYRPKRDDERTLGRLARRPRQVPPPLSDVFRPNDPLWPDMWYLHRGGSGLDHNVWDAWRQGVIGRNIVVTILDDGLERTHPDIRPNYDGMASFDINDHDDDPTPRYDVTNENRHGTRCAGEVAAIYNNSLCIVGIAYGARIGGIRMLDGDVTDAVEAASLSHNRAHVDIYSASWGPDDDGRTVDGPARLATIAFLRGIKQGRNGKGSVFVWASGNGGRDADSCNCDGYTNSVYTLSISSATENGNVPWYSEACSSTLATTYSSGAHGERMIVTTDLHHSCTNAHTGTSASAPLAAGISALALEANPGLTWRDLQHIVVRTARPERLRASDWVTNGVGRNVSHSFGFGLMDAGAMVRLARNWTNVPPQRVCRVAFPGRYKPIPHGSRLQVSLKTNGCSDDDGDHVVFVEHVQARVTLTAVKRGDIQIFLTSPAGTRSTLLAKRARDNSRAGYRDWPFMTTHKWGERAAGTWLLEVDNDSWDDATLVRASLDIYGTFDADAAPIKSDASVFNKFISLLKLGFNLDANLLKWDLVLYGTPGAIGANGGYSSAYLQSVSAAPPRPRCWAAAAVWLVALVRRL